MALEEFEKEEQSDRNKGYVLMKSIMDYGMGLLWMGMGVFLTFVKYFGEEFAQILERSLHSVSTIPGLKH